MCACVVGVGDWHGEERKTEVGLIHTYASMHKHIQTLHPLVCVSDRRQGSFRFRDDNFTG